MAYCLSSSSPRLSRLSSGSASRFAIVCRECAIVVLILRQSVRPYLLTIAFRKRWVVPNHLDVPAFDALASISFGHRRPPGRSIIILQIPFKGEKRPRARKYQIRTPKS